MERMRLAAAAVMVGGLVAAIIFVPFTITHGPTSYNLDKELLRWDMHRWGLVIGSVYPLLVGIGLWPFRRLLAGEGRAAMRALTVICVTMYLFAVMTVLARALGPPFEIFVLAPASIVTAITTTRRGAVRLVLAALAVVYTATVAIQFLPMETSDDLGAFRIYGLLAYVGAGILWALLGLVIWNGLMSTPRSDPAAR